MTATRTLWTPDLDQRLRDLVGKGVEVPEIAADLGLGQQSIYSRLNRLGVRTRTAVTAPVREAILRRHHQGWRASRIARQVGLEEGIVEAVIAGTPKAPCPRSAARHAHTPAQQADRARRIEEMHAAGVPKSQIATAMGVTTAAIHHRIRRQTGASA